MGHHDESLIDKVKNAFGMGDAGEHREDTPRDDSPAAASESADGWAGVPGALYDDTSATDGSPTSGTADSESGLGRNPGPVGSAQYEDGVTPADFAGDDLDADGDVDTSREDAVATEFGGAYGADDTPMPTSAAWDRGEAMPAGEAGLEDDSGETAAEDELDRRGTGI
jgi:hypothetical protein